MLPNGRSRHQPGKPQCEVSLLVTRKIGPVMIETVVDYTRLQTTYLRRAHGEVEQIFSEDFCSQGVGSSASVGWDSVGHRIWAGGILYGQG